MWYQNKLKGPRAMPKIKKYCIYNQISFTNLIDFVSVTLT